MRTVLVLSLASVFAGASLAQDKASTRADAAPRDLAALLTAHSPALAEVVQKASANRLQIELAEPYLRDDGTIAMRRSTFGDAKRYVYPASTVKLAAAVATLLELQQRATEPAQAFDLGAEWRIGTRFEGDAESEWLSIDRDLRAMLVVSDNEAFNHCYEFVGPRRINTAMWDAGLASFRIWHRLSEPRTLLECQQTRPIALRQGGREFASTARDEPFALDNASFDNAAFTDLSIGTGHLRGNKVVAEPMSFAEKNAVSIRDLQDLLVMVLRPEIQLGKKGFPQLSVSARAFLVRELGRLSRESTAPVFDPAKYPDDWAKFVLPGVRRVVPQEHARVYDKSGRAYGFTLDNAYVEDTRTGRGFFLTAVLYTNDDGVVGDDRYEYETVADPFFAGLGEAVAKAVFGGAGTAPASARSK